MVVSWIHDNRTLWQSKHAGLELVLGDIKISTSIRYLLYEIDIFDISISRCFQLFPISVHINKQNWPFCEEFLWHFDTFKPILPFLYRHCIRYRLFDISICISRLIMETMLRRICKPIRYIEILPSTRSVILNRKFHDDGKLGIP